MFLISWNVAGWSTTSSAIRDSYGTLEAFLAMTQADIVCLQETKISREKLNHDAVSAGAADPPSSSSRTNAAAMPPPVNFSSPFTCSSHVDGALVQGKRNTGSDHHHLEGQGGRAPLSSGIPGWESFWAHSARQHRGMNGVATLVRASLTLACDNRPFEDEALNDEGRCVVTYHESFIVVNVYVPNARGGTQLDHKMSFLAALEKLMMRLRRGEEKGKESATNRVNTSKKANPQSWKATPRPVILAGDFNITYLAEDAAWWFRRLELRQLAAMLDYYNRHEEQAEKQKNKNKNGDGGVDFPFAPDETLLNHFIRCVCFFLCQQIPGMLAYHKQAKGERKREREGSRDAEAVNEDQVGRMKAKNNTGRREACGAEDRPPPQHRGAAALLVFSRSSSVLAPSIAVDSGPSPKSEWRSIADVSCINWEELERIDSLLHRSSTLLSSRPPSGDCSSLFTIPPVTPKAAGAPGLAQLLPSSPDLDLGEDVGTISLKELISAGFTSVPVSEFLHGSSTATSFRPIDTAWNREVVFPLTRLAGLPPHADETIHFMSQLLQRPLRAGSAQRFSAGSHEGEAAAAANAVDRMWDSFLVPGDDGARYCPLPFTCWDQQRNRRHTNEGTRLDYILVDEALRPFIIPRANTENNTGPSLLGGCGGGGGWPTSLNEREDFFGEYVNGAHHRQSLRRATAGGAYPPAAYDGSGIPPLSLHAREWMWRGLPSTGLWVTPPQYSDHIGVCLLMREMPRGSDGVRAPVMEFHSPCQYRPPRNLFSFMPQAPPPSSGIENGNGNGRGRRTPEKRGEVIDVDADN